MQTESLERETISAKPERFDYEQRRYYDTVTWLAEVLPGAMRTPSEYAFDGRELYASDGGTLGKIFDDAIEEAKTLPAELSFERRRRLIEKEEYRDMLAMMRGELPNTMVVVSDFPPELMDAADDVGGYNAGRKQTMLRVLARTPQGTLKMYSQSLDGSNRQALEAIFEHIGLNAEPGELLGQRIHVDFDPHEQEFLTDQLTGVYDRSLRQQFGGEWYAGRRNGNRINTYDFVRQQSDLINTYMAITDSFTGGEAEYNLAAAMKRRLEGGPVQHVLQPVYFTGLPVAAHVYALDEMSTAGKVARERGDVYSGCGGTVRADNNENSLTAGLQLEAAGYGNKAETAEDKYGPLTFTCPKGHKNTRPRGKLIPKCTTCGTSVMCSKEDKEK